MVIKFYVYILSNSFNNVLYVGFTNNIKRRVEEHKNKEKKGFTQTYNVDKLVYFEEFFQPSKAIHREKCIKRWKREWKDDLINSENPDWKDLFDQL